MQYHIVDFCESAQGKILFLSSFVDVKCIFALFCFKSKPHPRQGALLRVLHNDSHPRSRILLTTRSSCLTVELLFVPFVKKKCTSALVPSPSSPRRAAACSSHQFCVRNPGFRLGQGLACLIAVFLLETSQRCWNVLSPISSSFDTRLRSRAWIRR